MRIKRRATLPVVEVLGSWALALMLIATLAGCGGTGGSVPAPDLGGSLAYESAAQGFGYPLSEQTLANYLATGNAPAMRAHAWGIWAALTKTSSSHVPIMLTWYQNREVFGAGTIDNPRTFVPQFLDGPPDSLGDGNPPISFNVYNQSYRDHVRANSYQWRSTLTSLVGKQPVIADFPSDAIAVKTVWWPVRHDGLTALPVWDNNPMRPLTWGTGISLLVDQGYFGSLTPQQIAELKSHEKQGNEWGSFQRIVAIDPSRSTIPAGETANLMFFDPSDVTLQQNTIRTAEVVPLKSFYYVRATDAATVEKLNQGLIGQLTQRFWGRAFTQDDYLALIAVHVATREAPDWVWATFWWHDVPNAAPYGNDRPATVRHPFDQFRMEVAQSADLPAAPDGTQHIAFNPYLEAGFALGTESNCIGCHQRAQWTSKGPGEVYPVHRGSMSHDDPFFSGNLRTHLLWSLVFRPRPAAGPAGGSLPECEEGVLCDQ